MDRSPFLQGDDASPAKARRDRIQLILLLALSAALAWLGSFGPAFNVTTLRPAFATIGSLRTTLEGVAEKRSAVEEELARERGRRALAEKSAHEFQMENSELRRLSHLQHQFQHEAPGRAGVSGPIAGSSSPIAGSSSPIWKMVRVMGVTPAKNRHEFVINAGTEDGITRGAAVTAYTPWGLALAGRVIECGVSASRVLAVTDPSSAVPVRVEGQGTGLLFQGGYPTSVGKLLYLRRDAVIKHYAEVRLVDISAAGGCLVGWITERHAGDGALSAVVDVLAAVEPARLNFVWVESWQSPGLPVR